jgi:cephalosporin hydroxylase
MPPPDEHIPPPARWSLHRPSIDYWADRVKQSTRDSYAGVPLGKFPEDLRVYEHILWLDAPDTIIEIGAYSGGSALWFRDRLRALEHYGRIRDPRVISIDVDVSLPTGTLTRVDPGWERDITLVAGDVTDPALPEQIAALVRPDARCLVIEDSAHTYETTAAALRGFARFVPPQGFFVVEDGYVDVDRLKLGPKWGWDAPSGVLPALREWLATEQGREFESRRDFEVYGITSHPEGFLRRIGPR